MALAMLFIQVLFLNRRLCNN